MPYIHEHPDWPSLTWDDGSLVQQLTSVRHKQGRLLGRMEMLGFDLKREASLTALTAEIVKSSAIESQNLDPGEVRSSIARQMGLDIAGLQVSRRETDGLVEMMLDATQNFAAPLTEARLAGWHTALFPVGHSGLSQIVVGRWRPPEADPMQVISGRYGRRRVHFQAPAADRLDNEMDRFLNWFNTDDSIDPMIKAGLAHFWFVTIHPFEDGNGRIARAIADLALARADQQPQRFYSMSAQIAIERNDYYDILEHAQRGGPDITDWLAWFLACLDRAITAADNLLDHVLYKARFWQFAHRQGLNDRQQLILTRMLDDFEGYLTTSKYAKLAKCSTDTALRDIRELRSYGLIQQNSAGGRSTSYRLSTAAEIGE